MEPGPSPKPKPPLLPIFLFIDFAALSSSAGDSMCETVPALTSSSSIATDACASAAEHSTRARLGYPRSSRRFTSGAVPLLPSTASAAVVPERASSQSASPSVPREVPETSISST